MNPREILHLRRLPARLDAAQCAALLGFTETDIAVLCRHSELHYLGGKHVAPNARKWFATIEVLQCAESREWLSKATKIIYQSWQRKNGRKALAHTVQRPAATPADSTEPVRE